MPEMILVTSSLIKAVGYDAADKELTVEFHKGKLTKYVYEGVPRLVFDALMEAKSAGAFFLRNIKSQYSCVEAH
jgi:hypothetical protein